MVATRHKSHTVRIVCAGTLSVYQVCQCVLYARREKDQSRQPARRLAGATRGSIPTRALGGVCANIFRTKSLGPWPAGDPRQKKDKVRATSWLAKKMPQQRTSITNHSSLEVLMEGGEGRTESEDVGPPQVQKKSLFPPRVMARTPVV